MEEVTPVEPGTVPKKKVVTFHVPKWLVWTVSVLALLGCAGLVSWHMGWVTRAWNHYQQASIVIKVKDGDTIAVQGAKVVLDGQTATTDSNGRVSVDHIIAGTYTAKVTKDGYDVASKSLTLHRGENDLQIISLKKLPAQLYAIKGFVQDYVSGKPIVNVQVTLADRTVLTDPNGAYHFDNNSPGAVTLTLSKAGYQDKQLPLTITSADVVSAQVPLVSTGQVVFTSNRDGKRLLYASDYSGANQHLFLKDDAGEDFSPVMSPDGKWIVFSSTRDHVKDNYGQDFTKLYVVASDGTKLTALSDDVSYTFGPIWSPNSQFIYFNGFSDAQHFTSTYRVYSIAKSSLLDIGEAADSVVFSPSGTLLAYYVSTSAPNPAAASDSTQSPYITQNVLKTWNLVTGERKSLASRTQYLTQLRFTPDSTAVSYEVTVDSVRHRYQDIISSGTETEVTADTAPKLQYVLSPDGKSEAVVDQRDGKYDLFLTDTSLQNPQRLTTLGVVDQVALPQWSPDSSDIIFTVKREAESALYIVAATGGDPKKIADYDLDE